MKKQILFWLFILSAIIGFADESSQKTNNTNYNIPDGQSTSNAGFNKSYVTFSGLPYNGKITKVQYNFAINHSYHGNLAARISTNSDPTQSPSFKVFGANTQNGYGTLYKSGTIYDFNNMNPNQTFYLGVWDVSPGYTGYIDYFTITVYYSVPVQNPTVNSVSPNNATLGQSVTFHIYGQNLTNNMVWHIDDFGNGAVNNSSSSTHKTFNATAQYTTGYKNGVIKTQSGGTVLKTFQVYVSYPAPTGLTATAQSASSININWNSVSNADKYKLYRSNSAYGSYSQIYSGSNRYYYDTGLSPNTTYYYKVKACENSSSGSCSDMSSYTSATTPAEAIPNPTVTLTNPNNGSFTVGENINIKWNSTNQHHFGLYLLKGNAQVAIIYETNSSTANSYNWQIQSPLSSGHIIGGSDYKIQIKVWNNNNPSYAHDESYSYLNISPPPTTIGNNFGGSTANQVVIRWGYKAPYSTYKIYRQLGLDESTRIHVGTKNGVTGPTTAIYTDNNNIQPSTEYCYIVQTCYNNSCSEDSPIHCHTTTNLDPPTTYSVSGRVTDAGQGLANVNISMSLTGYQTTTDNQGYYTLNGITQHDNGYLKAYKTGYNFSPANYYIANLSQNLTNYDFSASPSSLPAPALQAYPNSQTSIKLTWDAVPGANYYKAFYSNGDPCTEAEYIQGTAVHVHGLNPNQEYCFYILAYENNDGTGLVSSQSNIACATPGLPIPTVQLIAPNGGESFTQGQDINISWSSTGQHHYGLYLLKGNNQIMDIHLTNNSTEESYTWNIPTNLANGNDYKVKVVVWNSGDTTLEEHVADISNNYFTIQSGGSGSQATVELNHPNQGDYFIGEQINIQWTSTNQHHHGIYLYKGGTAPENQIATINLTNGNNDNGVQSYEWEVQSTVTDNNNNTHVINGTDYKIKIAVWDANGEAVGDYSSDYISLLPNSDCQYTDAPVGHYAHDAAVYLCEQGLLQNDGNCEADSLINRAELAKLAFLSIDLQDTPIADLYPSPFQDLQDPNTWYYTYAKNLSYLEYGDGISPFDKTFFNFYPSRYISRAHALKVLLETWNVELETGSLPFTDVETSHEAYKYIYTAYQLGLISDNDQHIFGPNANAYRGEVFVWLYRMMDVLGLPKPIPTAADFFVTGNYRPENFATFGAMHSGNFNFYTKTSFAIAATGLSLGFAHTYNSYLNEMPRELSAVKPLGYMWNHSYNSFINEIPGDEDFPENFRVVVSLPNSGFHVYKLNGTQYVCETQGVYNTLNKPTANKFTITTKGQIVYTYEKLSGTSNFPYVLVSIHDRNNNMMTIQYEAGQDPEHPDYKRIVSVTGTAGRKLQFFYHTSSDLIDYIKDPMGRKVYFTYDNGLLKTFKDAKGQVTTYNYGTGSEADLLMSIQLPKGNTVFNTYEDRKLASSKTNGNQPTQYAYNRNYGQNTPNNYITTTITDPNNKTAEIQYNKAGNPNHIAKNNNTVNITYKATQPDLPENIEINGKNTSYIYDNKGNLTKATLPMGVSYRYEYNTLNDVTKFTDPKGNEYTYEYDNHGNLIKVTTPRSASNFMVNSKGQVTKATNPMGIAVNYNYDTYGNIIKTQAPEGITVQSTYDIISRLLSVTNPNGHTVNYQYDNNDNMLKETFNGQHTQYAFDANNNLTSIINAKGFATNMDYDFDNDLLKEVSFEGATDKYTYYDDGKAKTYTDPKGTVFTYSYDNQDRLKTISAPGANPISYTYDAHNNIESVSNSNGTISYVYDDLNRLISTTDYYNNTIQYSYDLNSNLTAITYPGNKKVDYTYYNDNLLESVTDWMGNTTEYTYRNDGALTKVTYPNGTYNEYQYDNAGRMIAMGWKKSDGSVINHYAFTLDPMGNHLSESKTELYDAFNITNSTENYSYNNSNRMLSAAGNSFTYDANGNTTAGNGNTYSYDAYDQLTAVSGNLQAQYSYDANGNRRKRVLNGIETRYVLDEIGLSKVLIETNAANQAQYYYVYGAGLLYRIKASDNSVQYYHYDFRGSTTAITDAAGSVTHKYQYNDFGQIVQSEEAESNPYRYVGKYGICYESEQLYFMRARYYNPQIGRFLSEDPIWSTNLYPYADNNPISFIDITGKYIDPATGKYMITTNDIKNIPTEEYGKLTKQVRLPNGKWITYDRLTIYYKDEKTKSQKYYYKYNVYNVNSELEKNFTVKPSLGKNYGDNEIKEFIESESNEWLAKKKKREKKLFVNTNNQRERKRKKTGPEILLNEITNGTLYLNKKIGFQFNVNHKPSCPMCF